MTRRNPVLAMVVLVWCYRWTRRALVGVGVLVVLVLCTHHYGSDQTANQGWTFGSDSAYVGYETVGDPGWFGQLSTAFGTLNYFGADDGLSWCAAGKSDVECGA